MRSSPSRRIFARRPVARQARDGIPRERGPADRRLLSSECHRPPAGVRLADVRADGDRHGPRLRRGLLPGLGGPTTLALMLPFVFKMTPIEAFAFLLGMLAVTATTGDITSILFGIPGEPTTAATIVDGHAMAKNGEAGRALGAAMMSSLIGAVFGALVLGLALPVV